MESTRFKLSPNNLEGAGFYSKITFWWIGKVLKRICRNDCTVKDLLKPLTGNVSRILTDRLEV